MQATVDLTHHPTTKYPYTDFHLSVNSGKKINLGLTGEDIRIDKFISEGNKKKTGEKPIKEEPILSQVMPPKTQSFTTNESYSIDNEFCPDNSGRI